MIIDRIFPTKPNIPTDGIRTPRKTLVNIEPLLLVIFDTSLEPKNPHFSSHWSFDFDGFTRGYRELLDHSMLRQIFNKKSKVRPKTPTTSKVIP